MEDADIILGTYIPSDLEVGETYLIPVYDRYERITKIEQTIGSEILSARVIRDTVDWQEYIEITALRAGRTTLKVTDVEGNIATIEVTIALTKDDCADGDYTGDEYDGECGAPPDPEEDIYWELDAFLQELFGEFGLELTNEEGIVVSSVPNALSCELWNTETYWVRPYNAVCVDNVSDAAWECKEGYRDMYAYGINTCVSEDFYQNYYLPKKEIFNKISQIWENTLNKAWSDKILLLFNSFVQTQEQWVAKYSWVRWEIYNFVYDDLRNSALRRIDSGYKSKKDLETWFLAMKIVSDGGFYLDWYIPEYTNKDVETFVTRFSQELEDYMYDYSNEYNSWLQNYASGQTSSQEIINGAREWVVEGTKDYLMSYYETLETLSDLKLDDIKSWVKWLWNKVTNPIDTLTSIYAGYSQAITELYDQVATMSWYEKSKGWSYVATNISLSTVDPAGKVVTLAGGGFFLKIGGKLNILRKISFIKKIKYDDIQLQEKFKHAVDFWIEGNYNLENREKFRQALNNHVNNDKTEIKRGTYRTTQQVEHFYNPETWINVMYDLDWNFISWWKLWDLQIDYLNTTWNIQ